MRQIKFKHAIWIMIGFSVFPLLGVIYFHTNGLVGGFLIGCVIAAIVHLVANPKENPGKADSSPES